MSIRDLTVAFPDPHGPVTVVRGVSLDLPAGQVFGLAGESGSGKSTVAQAALRLLPPAARVGGRVSVDGEDLLTASWGRLRRLRWTTLAVALQGADLLNPVRRVAAQIAGPMRLHGTVPRTRIRARVVELLELVGLDPACGRARPHQLSGGQAQRAAIAVALACDPRVLVVDETTTGLDLITRADVVGLLTTVARRGAAVLMISHDLPLLAAACDRLAVLHAGRVVENGPAAAVLRAPVHPYTRALVDAAGTLGDPRSRLRPRGLPGTAPHPAFPEPGCAFRPRCAAAVASCGAEPTLAPVAAAHWAACHLAAG